MNRSTSVVYRQLKAAVITTGLATAVTVLAYWFNSQRASSDRDGPEGHAHHESQFLPAGDYAGSQTCRDCHDAIFESYFSTHGMGRSMAPIATAVLIENYEQRAFRTPDGRQYDVTKTADQCVHREFLVDDQGELLFEESAEVRYAIGSGKRGRGYLLLREGRLYQSPISWYTQRACWDLSPGYLPGQHERFLRPITTECLFCHAGRLHVAGGSDGSERFADPPFEEPAIGCERCHGPAGEHVRRRSAGLPDDSLRDLRQLEPERRDAICWQCHLRASMWISHPGKNRFSFRPGDLLEEHVLVVPEDSDLEQGRPGASVVMQLFSSRCYNESRGTLGCISCHDPHARPAEPDRPSYYQSKCLQCHEDGSCGLSISERSNSPSGNFCISCHMPRLPTPSVPHTALTDHRILARPNLSLAENRKTARVQFFREDQLRVSVQLLRRARGIALAELASRGQSDLAAEAVPLLQDACREFTSDPVSLVHLGTAFAILGRFDDARRVWQDALTLDAQNPDLLRKLVVLEFSAGNTQKALDLLQRWKELDPNSPELYFIQSRALHRLGRTDEALQAGWELVRRDPTALAGRQWLIELLDMSRQGHEADRQRAWVQRFVQVMQKRTQRSSQ